MFKSGTDPAEGVEDEEEVRIWGLGDRSKPGNGGKRNSENT